MIKQTLVALAMLCLAINTTAQIMQNATARYYLPTASSFTQSQIDSYNVANLYMFDIVNGQALTYPDLTPIQLTWNGTTWVAPTPIAITSAFTTSLMVGSISHTATTTAGALAPSIVVDWADVSGVTQYRFRIRPIGGTWSTSTITGSERTLNTLQYSTTYECQVRVYINSTTQGEYTNTYTFTTPAFVPLPSCNAPTTTANIIGNQLVISWNAVHQAVAYQVQYRQIGSLAWGGTTITTTTHTTTIDTTKAYEYQVRTNCTGASTTWSAFTPTDTISKAICTPPTGLYNVANTFYFTPNSYGIITQFEHRLVGTNTWGGTSTSSNSVTINGLWGQHEWRVRTRCFATTNTGWTAWTTAVTGLIPKPMMFQPIEETLKPEVIYDLTGRKLNVSREELPVGIYIINGEKVGIVK